MNYIDYRNQWYSSGDGLITSAPTHLDLELSSACNFQCVMCPQTETPSKFSKGFMDRSLALRLLNEAKKIGVLSVKLNWRGESTLCPDFIEIANHAVDLGFIDVMLNTNGGYTDNAVRRAVHILDTVIFSIDTLKTETADKIRPGRPLETVTFNLNAAVKSRLSFGRPKIIRVNVTSQKENAGELETIRKYCRDKDVECYIKPVFPRNHHNKDQYYDRDNIKITGRKNCGYPFQRLVVSYEGLVAPCCVPWYNTLLVGDAREDSLLEIWNGEKINEIRDDALSASYNHPTCINCTSWASFRIIERENMLCSLI